MILRIIDFEVIGVQDEKLCPQCGMALSIFKEKLAVKLCCSHCGRYERTVAIEHFNKDKANPGETKRRQQDKLLNSLQNEIEKPMNSELSQDIPQLRILLVDDDNSSLVLLKKIIEREGYRVEVSSNPFTAVLMLEKQKYHIIVTDIMMPEMDGIELLAVIKKRNPLTQVVMMTSGVSMSRTISALELGATDFILKPIQAEELLIAIRVCEVKLKRWQRIMRAIGYGNLGGK